MSIFPNAISLVRDALLLSELSSFFIDLRRLLISSLLLLFENLSERFSVEISLTISDASLIREMDLISM